MPRDFFRGKVLFQGSKELLGILAGERWSRLDRARHGDPIMRRFAPTVNRDVAGGCVAPVSLYTLSVPTPIPLFYRLLLRRPDRVLWHLDKLHDAGLIDARPNLWQVSMGVFYMVHRALFRPETIGIGKENVRPTLRARLLRFRPLRAPFMLWQRALDPIDLTGLAGSVERKLSHLVGAYHPGENALYDLECIGWDRDSIERLRDDVQRIIDATSGREAFLKDLTVYEGYHERLLSLVDRVLAGDFAPKNGNPEHPDTTLRAFVRWCASQPDSPEATLAALGRGQLRFGPA